MCVRDASSSTGRGLGVRIFTLLSFLLPYRFEVDPAPLRICIQRLLKTA
jgi:hypothetical protein